MDWVKDVAYNAAGQITTMSYVRDPNGSSYFTEPRQYNILQQLTRLTVPGVMDHEYRFSTTQNDGRRARTGYPGKRSPTSTTR